MSTIDIDFLAIFKEQLSGEIRSVTENILKFENNYEDTETLHTLMREFHTIKGAARAINFTEIKEIAHRVEDVYHALIEKKVRPHSSLVDLTLYSLDLINGVLDAKLNNKQFTAQNALPDLVDTFLEGKIPNIPKIRPKNIDKKTPEQTHIENQNKNQNQTQDKDQDQDQDKDKNFFDDSEELLIPFSKDTKDVIDSLSNISGEISVNIVSIDSVHQNMRNILADINNLYKELSFGNVDRNMDYETLTKVKSLKDAQTSSIDLIDNIQSRLKQLSLELENKITYSRLIPIDMLFSKYPRIVRDLSKELGKECEITIKGRKTRIDSSVIEAIRVPLLHLIRNAISHGIEMPEVREQKGKTRAGNINLEAIQTGSQIQINFSDDGAGIDMDIVKKKVIERGYTTKDLWDVMTVQEQLQFLFLPGFTTSDKITEVSGRGMGLDIVKTEIEQVGGRVEIQSPYDVGVKFKLELPITLSLSRCILVNGGTHPFFNEQLYAFHMNDIEKIVHFDPNEVIMIDGYQSLKFGNEIIRLYDFVAYMKNKSEKSNKDKYMLILGSPIAHIGLLVDEILGDPYIVIRKADDLLGKMQDIDGFTILNDGRIALIIDSKDIIHSIEMSQNEIVSKPSKEETISKHILVVEDSHTVREVERHFLEMAGYMVTIAVNGIDGLNKVKSNSFDLIISDIDMPRMNGLEMIKNIRTDSDYKKIPIIVVSYKDREEDYQKAMELGVNLYVTKSEFDSQNMLEKIARILEAK